MLMRVAMYYRNNDVRLEEAEKPEIGPGELLVKVEACGICGSDVMEWYRIHKAPLVLGHEIAGTIEEVGEGVKGYSVGDRISASHHVPCNTCDFCLSGHHTVCDTLRSTTFYPGGFSEYLRLPPINVDRGVYRIPDSVSMEEATFTEPLACVLRGQKMADIKPGNSVLVIGSGISGLLHIQLAKALGAGHIIATDISEHRLAAAERFGADTTIHAKEDVVAGVRKALCGKLADRIILTTGVGTAINQAFKSIERGGTILFFAPTDQGVTIPLSINDLFWRNDITLTTTYAGSPADHVTALELIRAGRVNVKDMVTHRFSLAEAQKGFQLVAAGGGSIKVIVECLK